MKSRFECNLGSKQQEQEICTAIGYEKPPDENAPVEEHDRYIFAAMRYLKKKEMERNGKWKKLERGKEFIRQMRSQPFSFVKNEDEGLPEFKKFTDPPPVRTSKTKGARKAPTAEVERHGHRERPRHTTERPKKRPNEDEPQTQTQTQTQTQAHTQAHTQESCATAPPDGDQNAPKQESQAAKRRRLTEELSTSLGEGWDAHVDNKGHRVSRNSRRSPH